MMMARIFFTAYDSGNTGIYGQKSLHRNHSLSHGYQLTLVGTLRSGTSSKVMTGSPAAATTQSVIRKDDSLQPPTRVVSGFLIETVGNKF